MRKALQRRSLIFFFGILRFLWNFLSNPRYTKKMGETILGELLKILFFIFHFCFSLFAGIGCSSGDSIRRTPEPALEQVLFNSDSFCPGFHLFCFDGDTRSLSFRGVFKNSTSEKSIFLDYYLSSFEVSFPIGVSLKLDGDWFNLRKVGTDYSDSVRISSFVPTEVADKIIHAKEIAFSFSSREKTINRFFSPVETAKFQFLLKSLREKLDTQSNLNILNP
ncbi:hypothetical protein LEP1GSC103_1608 [Leptospira borgpetersenii serovar Javanica str. UI 09931]|uniref:Uncharacterized protein n=4 Tax=Leptospira borgpetersenii TaxID=174 RepID=M3GBY4_LEPBO|nr:hypothetical protein LEP1GSC128_0259 [Leptospira borgpetersenii str. 200801926]EKQ90848.1 hypothetical protein LEP1GSC101_1193 [Leptospira borgpetersenii str. UI 09149]EKR00592.1 hypothetical protein LEP1GSC121_1185 [Leptospira borgpetersenii serovar Castellonis str. 200801910]EMF98421.1 hypothetical protein LEP1GSC123_1483 [Leptospira borgpetersenii str. 200701203]EMN18777.1 hypothetical protein LEP1GSC056_1208 [Leptospira borgpetersenii str. Brem 328]EMN56761.1 hypothetical protein LEP1GS